MSYLRKKYIQDSSDSDKNSDDEIENIKKSPPKQTNQKLPFKFEYGL